MEVVALKYVGDDAYEVRVAGELCLGPSFTATAYWDPEEETEMFHQPDGKSLIPVKKSELLERMKLTRQKHVHDYEEAIAGYRKEAIEALHQAYEDAKKGERIRLNIHLEEPQNHKKAYDHAICALEMTTATEISLTDTQFSSWVMDDWSWKGAFVASTSNYVGKGR